MRTSFAPNTCVPMILAGSRSAGLKMLRQGQQAGVTPHAGRALRDLLARNLRAESIVIVADFEWRETIVTDGAGLVSPALPAFATSQFVLGHGLLFLSRSRRRANQPYKRNPLFPEWKKRNEMQKNATHPESHVPRFQERVGTWRSG